ncbi:multidrug efflux system subunit MdtC [Roseimaritima multifibrata]|uniref:Multidrug efflux system subunit MdtC n=1 Tax=Roseimaritima multifibrata TaxID=1930274 RepID=A0A517MF78_9BACT|nr:efflux RND transporter permease subunit [Roseimaritima multifibrata]QDS93544.1 multidrug efflux system subunit MdtC [Roseimaritima multifibrata]
MSEAEPEEKQGEPKTPISERLLLAWADRPGLQLAVMLLLSALAIVGYTQPTLVTDLFHPTPASVSPFGAPSVRLVSNRQPSVNSNRTEPDVTNTEAFEFGGGECLLVVETEDFFTPEGLAALRRVAHDLEQLPQVESVLWLDNVPNFNLFGLSGTLLPGPHASQRRLTTAAKAILDNPLAVGQFISADGNTIVMQIRIDWFHVSTDAAVTSDLRECAEHAIAEFKSVQANVLVTGRVPLHLMMASNHVKNAQQYQIIGYAIMLIAALILFRGLSAVVIVATAPAMGVFWTMGFLHFFDLQNNPFNDIIVPVLISLVGLTDAVHLMVEIRTRKSQGRTTSEATRQGVAHVGLACVLTSLTTAIGFVSLGWAHHEIVREFGWCCVLGVGLTLVSVLTMTPLGCRSPLGRRLHIGIGAGPIDGQIRYLSPLVRYVLRHDRAITAFAIFATAGLGLLTLQLQPDEKRYSGLSDSGEAAIGMRHLDRSLGGLEFGNIEVRWQGPETPDELLPALQEIDAVLQSEPLLGNPLGLPQVLAALPGDGPAAERMTLLTLLPPSIKRAFYRPNEAFAATSFRVQDRGIAAYSGAFTNIESTLASLQQQYPMLQFELTGNAPRRWRNVYQIVNDLANSLGTASIVIWLVLTLVYRSIRIGLISIIPNLFPLVATGAILFIFGQHLELVTVCVFTICLGIAVDDSIHFLTRYQLEQRRGGDHQAVIERAFTGVGSALLMTTLVLVAGMLTAVVGDARDARLFGVMGCLTLLAALFADVLLLPAILSYFSPKRYNADRVRTSK